MNHPLGVGPLLEDYWPNLRTLSICNGLVTLMRFEKGVLNAPYYRRTTKIVHHIFGVLVTPKLRWIVLRNVDIEGVAMNGAAWSETVPAAKLCSVSNPYNGGKIVHFVERTNTADVVVTVKYKFFGYPFHENSQQQLLDILEEECQPVPLAERLEFEQRISAISCAYFFVFVEDARRCIARLEPICRGLDWRGALATVARWRHLSFRALRAAVNGIMFCVEPPHQPFNQFFCCYPLYLEFNQRCEAHGFGPNTYNEAIAHHVTENFGQPARYEGYPD